MTELQTLKAKKKEGKATQEDLTRLKVLQDGEPLSKVDLEVARQREADRAVANKASFDAKQAEKTKINFNQGAPSEPIPLKPEPPLARKLEWSGSRRGPGSGPMSSGGDGALSRSCPCCKNIDPSSPNVGSWIKEAIGHKPDCSLAAEIKASELKAASLDVPPDHPRITALKEALLPFTKIEAHDSRPNEFVLFVRGIAITAGDVRKARKAMKL